MKQDTTGDRTSLRDVVVKLDAGPAPAKKGPAKKAPSGAFGSKHFALTTQGYIEAAAFGSIQYITGLVTAVIRSALASIQIWLQEEDGVPPNTLLSLALKSATISGFPAGVQRDSVVTVEVVLSGCGYNPDTVTPRLAFVLPIEMTATVTYDARIARTDEGLLSFSTEYLDLKNPDLDLTNDAGFLLSDETKERVASRLLPVLDAVPTALRKLNDLLSAAAEASDQVRAQKFIAMRFVAGGVVLIAYTRLPHWPPIEGVELHDVPRTSDRLYHVIEWDERWGEWRDLLADSENEEEDRLVQPDATRLAADLSRYGDYVVQFTASGLLVRMLHKFWSVYHENIGPGFPGIISVRDAPSLEIAPGRLTIHVPLRAHFAGVTDNFSIELRAPFFLDNFARPTIGRPTFHVLGLSPIVELVVQIFFTIFEGLLDITEYIGNIFSDTHVDIHAVPDTAVDNLAGSDIDLEPILDGLADEGLAHTLEEFVEARIPEPMDLIDVDSLLEGWEVPGLANVTVPLVAKLGATSITTGPEIGVILAGTPYFVGSRRVELGDDRLALAWQAAGSGYGDGVAREFSLAGATTVASITQIMAPEGGDQGPRILPAGEQTRLYVLNNTQRMSLAEFYRLTFYEIDDAFVAGSMSAVDAVELPSGLWTPNGLGEDGGLPEFPVFFAQVAGQAGPEWYAYCAPAAQPLEEWYIRARVREIMIPPWLSPRRAVERMERFYDSLPAGYYGGAQARATLIGFAPPKFGNPTISVRAVAARPRVEYFDILVPERRPSPDVPLNLREVRVRRWTEYDLVVTVDCQAVVGPIWATISLGGVGGSADVGTTSEALREKPVVFLELTASATFPITFGQFTSADNDNTSGRLHDRFTIDVTVRDSWDDRASRLNVFQGRTLSARLETAILVQRPAAGGVPVTEISPEGLAAASRRSKWDRQDLAHSVVWVDTSPGPGAAPEHRPKSDEFSDW